MNLALGLFVLCVLSVALWFQYRELRARYEERNR